MRYDLPFRLALKSGAVDSSTCLIGTAHGYHREEWQDQLAVWQLRVLHTVHLVLSYVLFLGAAHLQTEASVVGVWYLVFESFTCKIRPTCSCLDWVKLEFVDQQLRRQPKDSGALEQSF